MPVIQCPIEDCEYEAPDVESVVAAALITAHATSTSSAGTTEDWQYLAARLRGTDKVIQLLESCDDQLRKDLTRNAGGTLTGKTKENTMVARVATCQYVYLELG